MDMLYRDNFLAPSRNLLGQKRNGEGFSAAAVSMKMYDFQKEVVDPFSVDSVPNPRHFACPEEVNS